MHAAGCERCRLARGGINCWTHVWGWRGERHKALFYPCAWFQVRRSICSVGCASGVQTGDIRPAEWLDVDDCEWIYKPLHLLCEYRIDLWSMFVCLAGWLIRFAWICVYACFSVFVQTWKWKECIYPCVEMCMCECLCECMCKCGNVLKIYVEMCVFVCMCVCVFVCLCARVCV